MVWEENDFPELSLELYSAFVCVEQTQTKAAKVKLNVLCVCVWFHSGGRSENDDSFSPAEKKSDREWRDENGVHVGGVASESLSTPQGQFSNHKAPLTPPHAAWTALSCHTAPSELELGDMIM